MGKWRKLTLSERIAAKRDASRPPEEGQRRMATSIIPPKWEPMPKGYMFSEPARPGAMDAYKTPSHGARNNNPPERT